MGGKRPDQYRIDNDEAGATDYKFYPDQPGERRRDSGVYGRGMKGRARRRQPIPPRVPEPGAEKDRLDEWERQRRVHEAKSDADRKAKGGEPLPPGV